MSDLFDVVILGGGSAGYSAALRAAQLGLSVSLVEADKLGGTCLHRGCIPTKALLQAAASADTVGNAAGFGVQATFDGVDQNALLAYSDQVVNRLYQGLTGLIKAAGITVVQATGTLSLDPLGIATPEGLIPGRTIILATGARPSTLGLPIDGKRIITSEHALRLDALPSRAVVLGGGVIGVEFASAWASLGVEVTIVEAQDRLVFAEEPAVSALLLRAFRQRGIKVKLNTTVTGVDHDTDPLKLRFDDSSLETDLLLVATGRKADLIHSGTSGLEIAADLSTNIPNVYAAGDLVPGLQLAHRGYLHGQYLGELIAYQTGRYPTRPLLPQDSGLPRVTYCSPEIVSVGLTSAQAQATGEIETMDYDLMGNGKAQILAGAKRARGIVKIVRRANGPILGVHIIGDHVAELVGEANLLVNWQAEPDDLTGIVHAHPSLGEAFGEISLAFAGQPLHMHP